jgi:hypothetical protein
MAATANAVNITNRAVSRTIFRWIHIVFGIPILGYIYDSPSDTHNYAFSVRYVFLPVLLLSGLWMWKGHLLRRLVSKRSHSAQPNPSLSQKAKNGQPALDFMSSL